MRLMIGRDAGPLWNGGRDFRVSGKNVQPIRAECLAFVYISRLTTLFFSNIQALGVSETALFAGLCV